MVMRHVPTWVPFSLWTTQSPHSTVWWLNLSSCWIRCLLKWTYTGHKNHLKSAKLHPAADIFKLVCTHYYSSEAQRRDVIFRFSPWENYQPLLTSSMSNRMLNRVRPWIALENPRTEKPLITTSLPSFQHLHMLYLSTQIGKQKWLKNSSHRTLYTETALISHKCPPPPRTRVQYVQAPSFMS